MKVFLEAFGGKLKGVIEIPRNMPDIDLLLDLPMMTKTTGDESLAATISKRGRFERTHKSIYLKDVGIEEDGLARVYVLTDVF